MVKAATTFELTLAILLSWIGLSAIHFTWSRRDKAQSSILMAGWGSLIFAVFLSYVAYGDAGAAICVMVTSFLACILVVKANASHLNALLSPAKTSPKRTQARHAAPSPEMPGRRHYRAFAVFLLAGPGTIITAMSATLLLSRALARAGAAPADSIAAAFFAFPVIMSAISAYILMSRECLRRVAAWTGGVALTCCALTLILGAH